MTTKRTRLGKGIDDDGDLLGLSSECDKAAPRPVPTTMPMIAPKRARITASERIMARICRRFIPTARSSPISWVRSKTDSKRVLTMPMRAMSTARARRA